MVVHHLPIFIVPMEFPNIHIQISRNRGPITRVQLARTAPKLTNVMYADDLVIMRQATLQEVCEYKQILVVFARNSGLLYTRKINNLCFHLVWIVTYVSNTLWRGYELKVAGTMGAFWVLTTQKLVK